MRDAAIALHRYGLGGKGDAAPPSDPKRWLADQLAQYDPRPPAIAAQPQSRVVVDMLRDRRELQRDKKQAEMKPVAATISWTRPGLWSCKSRFVTFMSKPLAHAPIWRLRQAHHLPNGWSISWANHFAISVDKIVTTGLAGSFEFEAICPHVMGKFGAMLGAVERHPAMLLYLDQAQSIGPGSPIALRAALARQGDWPERKPGPRNS